MFKATFDIITGSVPKEEWQNSQLLMEVSPNAFSYTLYHKQSQRFLGYRQYNLQFLPDRSSLECLREVLTGDDLLQHPFRDTFVIYNYVDSNLLPEKNFHIELNKPVTELVYGNARKGLLLSEKVYGKGLYNVYRIPREVHTLMQQKFAAGKYWHYNTLLLTDMETDATAENILHIIIGADQFTVGVFRKNALHLLQTYTYQTPDDVSWHLLNICNRFRIKQEELQLRVSGLIDEQSNLYQELMKYFLQPQWEVLPESVKLAEGFREYPPHYFSPLLKLALCVS